MTSTLIAPDMPSPLADDVVRRIRTSRLDSVDHERFAAVPYYDLARALLLAVREHDLQGLEVLCDDDAGIVDVDPSGSSVMVRTRDEWVGWFQNLFATLDVLDAETDSEIIDFTSYPGSDIGWSVLEFRQFLEIGDLTATFECVATIIWKRTENGWREARWHCSVLSQDVPEPMLAAAAAA